MDPYEWPRETAPLVPWPPPVHMSDGMDKHDPHEHAAEVSGMGDIVTRKQDSEQSDQAAEQQEELRPHAHRDDKEQENGERSFREQSGISGDEAKDTGGSTDDRAGEVPADQERRRSLEDPSGYAAGEIERKVAANTEHLFEFATEHVYGPAIENEVQPAAMEELESDQLPKPAMPQAVNTERKIILDGESKPAPGGKLRQENGSVDNQEDQRHRQPHVEAGAPHIVAVI